ncbi:MAG TPA: hypothetical protein VEB66_02100 [Opitutaceae bacterium]|nr:hypothetical protein [Opitutaceae bacterium]
MNSTTLVRLGTLSLALVAATGMQAQAAAGAPVLVRAAAGQIYLADQGRILQIDTAQQRLRPVTPDISARRLLVDSENNLYAPSMRYDPRADLYRPTMWRYSPGGGVTEAKPAPSAGQFAFSDVVDAQGNLYFWQVDAKRMLSRILLRPKNGAPILLAGHNWGVRDGKGADAQFSRLGGMAVGPDGSLYVCDDQCVRRVARDGTVTTLARGGLLSLGAGRGEDNHLGAITVGDGNVFVADRATKRVLRIDAAGEVSTLVHGADDWQLASLAWTDGALYVLESGSGGNRVVRISPEGQRQVLPRAPLPPPGAEAPPLRLSDNGDTDARAPFLPMFFMPATGMPLGI